MEPKYRPEAHTSDHSQYDDVENPHQINILRRELTTLARGIRISTILEDASLSLPQSARDDEVLFGDKMVKRRRVVLLTPKCSTATCLMCPLPNEALDSKRRPITIEEINAQMDSVMADSEKSDFELLTLYNNGNFFADGEVPKPSREYIYELFKKSSARYMLVESLPQFVTEEKLAEAQKILGDKKLVVAIGLQSASDLVRAISVNTTCSRESFERAAALLNKYDCILQAFLMIKPPFLTEEEAIEDTVKSIGYLNKLGIENPILCATRVAPNTVLELLHNEREYHTPWLWSIIEVLKRSAIESPNCFPRVVVSELQKNKNRDSVVPTNCEICSDEVVRAIERFNQDRDIHALERLTCTCHSRYEEEKRWENETMGKTSLEERVEKFMNHRKLTGLKTI